METVDETPSGGEIIREIMIPLTGGSSSDSSASMPFVAGLDLLWFDKEGTTFCRLSLLMGGEPQTLTLRWKNGGWALELLDHHDTSWPWASRLHRLMHPDPLGSLSDNNARDILRAMRIYYEYNARLITRILEGTLTISFTTTTDAPFPFHALLHR